MEKINFKDLPNTSTPINAANLNAIQTNTENAINGIIDSGSNNYGSWIKYEDGTMIVYKTRAAQQVSITLPQGSLYRGSAILGDSPMEFIDTPCVFATNNGPTAAFIYYVDSPTTTSLGNVGLLRPFKEENGSVILQAVAIGRWK